MIAFGINLRNVLAWDNKQYKDELENYKKDKKKIKKNFKRKLLEEYENYIQQSENIDYITFLIQKITITNQNLIDYDEMIIKKYINKRSSDFFKTKGGFKNKTFITPTKEYYYFVFYQISKYPNLNLDNQLEYYLDKTITYFNSKQKL